MCDTKLQPRVFWFGVFGGSADSSLSEISEEEEAVRREPWNAVANYKWACVLESQGEEDKALQAYFRAVELDPSLGEAHHCIGEILQRQEEFLKASPHLQRAVQCDPRNSAYRDSLGLNYGYLGRFRDSENEFTAALSLDPESVASLTNLGWLTWSKGDVAATMRLYERACELHPDPRQGAHFNRLLMLNYLHGVPAASIYEAHRAWAERYCRSMEETPWESWPNSRKASKRIRLGYISPDFCAHSVALFSRCLVTQQNAEEFEVYLYSNVEAEDDTTSFFKEAVGASHWRRITNHPAEDVGDMIRDDGIDILVDLAGITADNRLDVMSLKPAPVQVAYIGYNNTTGFGAIDYRITDVVADPPDSAQPFAEELVRLPHCFLCFSPPSSAPNVAPLPALRAGRLTLGSFSNLAKITPAVIDAWAAALQAVPSSRLLLKAKGFLSDEIRIQFATLFQKRGIPSNRLELRPSTPGTFEHLQMYNEVDIGLDTFPYSNTTTACESIFMGVPMVTLAGDRHGARTAATLLTCVGLQQSCVATSVNDFVAKVQSLSRDLPGLATLRAGLRQQVLRSRLCDGPTFMQEDYEPALRRCWERYCEGQSPSEQVFSASEPKILAPHAFAPLSHGLDGVIPPAVQHVAPPAFQPASTRMLGDDDDTSNEGVLSFLRDIFACN